MLQDLKSDANDPKRTSRSETERERGDLIGPSFRQRCDGEVDDALAIAKNVDVPPRCRSGQKFWLSIPWNFERVRVALQAQVIHNIHIFSKNTGDFAKIGVSVL